MQTLTFQCGNCSKSLMVDSGLLGTKVRCPHCRQVVMAPARGVSVPAETERKRTPMPPKQPPGPDPVSPEPAQPDGANFRIKCGLCRKDLLITGDMLGKKVRCPHCRHIIVAPSEVVQAPTTPVPVRKAEAEAPPDKA